MEENKNNNCPNCGAPVTTEICPYCHAMTHLDTQEAAMEYPVIDCKEAGIGFWNVAFPMIFAVGFGFFGFIFPLLFIFSGDEDWLMVCLFCSIFAIVGVVSFVVAILPIIRTIIIKTKGHEIEATVYGYMDDNMLLNERPAQIVKLLVQTKDGPRFILYQLSDTKQPYQINSKIKLLAYKDKFLIVHKNETYF